MEPGGARALDGAGRPCEHARMATVLSPGEVESRPSLADWRVLDGRLAASFRSRTMVRGAEFVSRVVDVAEALNHHPDLDLRFARVHLTLVTHSAGGLTERDVALAERISELARDMDVPAEPARCRSLAFALPADDASAVAPFWQAVLGHRTAEGSKPVELNDRDGRLPPVRLVGTGPGGRPCLEIHVAGETLEDRVAQATKAGGRIVDEAGMPARVVLADAGGNLASLHTTRASHKSNS